MYLVLQDLGSLWLYPAYFTRHRRISSTTEFSGNERFSVLGMTLHRGVIASCFFSDLSSARNIFPQNHPSGTFGGVSDREGAAAACSTQTNSPPPLIFWKEKKRKVNFHKKPTFE